MRLFAIIFILLISNKLVFSQGSSRYIDSLAGIAERVSPDSAASIYSRLGHILAYQRPMEGLKYLRKALEHAERKKDYKALCYNYSFVGLCYGQMGIFEKSYENFNIQLEIAKKYKVDDEYIWANNNLGYALLILKNPTLAHGYLMEALKLAKDTRIPNILHNVYSNMGWMYLQSEQYDSSLYCYNNALQIRMQERLDPVMIGATYRDIGNVHFFSGEYDEAIRYYRLSEQYNDTTRSDISADINSHLAGIYLRRHELDSALYCVNNAIRIANRFCNSFILRYSYGVLGEIYTASGKFRDAEKAFANQICYNDTIYTDGSSVKIYESEFSKEIDRQNYDLIAVESHSRYNVIVAIVIAIIFALGIFLAIRLRKKRLIIESINQQMENTESLMDESLRYTRKIQKAVQPNFSDLAKMASDKFLLYRPQHLVSANFYWYYFSGRYNMFAVGKAGLPDIKGSCLAMISLSLLYEVAPSGDDPKAILTTIKKRFMTTIRNFDIGTQYAVTTDVSFLMVDTQTNKALFTGVKSPLIVIRNGEMRVYNDNADPNVYYFIAPLDTFEFDIQPGDCVYFVTDGYGKQRGGHNGEEYSQQRLNELLLQIWQKPMDEQRQIIEDSLDNWRGQREQDYDILISGFKI